MKKLVYGGLFLALVGIGFSGCKKELEQKLKSRIQNQFSLEADGKMLIFESSESFENLLANHKYGERGGIYIICK